MLFSQFLPISAAAEMAACTGMEFMACNQAGAALHACTRWPRPHMADRPHAMTKFMVTCGWGAGKGLGGARLHSESSSCSPHTAHPPLSSQ